MEKYDVGILGVWYGCNYGSVATYYCLYQTVEQMGKKVLMVHRPWKEPYDHASMERRLSMKFARAHYPISPSYCLDDLHQLNEQCDTFLLGSDQLWNYGITKIFGHSYFLDFAEPSKKKIAYATSFGGPRFLAPWTYARKAMACMRKMNHISVRETTGVTLCQKQFGVRAAHTLDPVLLCEASVLGALAEESGRKRPEHYLVAYILDPTPEKREALLYLSRQLNKELVVLLDGWPHLLSGNRKKMNLEEHVALNLTEEDWIAYLKYSDFVITDSFHGTCMALLFEKQFYAIENAARGADRFHSLVQELQLQSRCLKNPLQIMEEDIHKPVDYGPINEILNRQRAYSKAWLFDALWEGSPHVTGVDGKSWLYPLRMLKSAGMYYVKGWKDRRR